MKTEACREWRESLGAHALGQLGAEERAGLEAHMEGCQACREEAESLAGLSRLLPHADPARFGPAPTPPPELAGRVVTAIGAERRSARRRRRFRVGGGLVATAAAAAAAAAALAILVLPGGGGGQPSRWVAFSSLPHGMKIDAQLEPRPFGTEIRMYVEGVPSGTLCRVALRGPGGTPMPAGTFRYRWGGEDEAVLASAMDLSRARAVVVRVGRRAFVAPLGGRDKSQTNVTEEET